MFQAFDRGFLLRAGGLGDQPFWYVDIMETIAAERYACDIARIERDRRAREAADAAARAAASGGRRVG
jgi:hypothetical protein